jgi:Ser/Thr protein kinase RdoA (MazF antagonist)
MTALPAETLASAHAVLGHYGLHAQGIEVLAGGLINLSLRVSTAAGERFVLQRLHPIFEPGVNDNLDLVTGALRERGELAPRLLRTLREDHSVVHEGARWRMLSHIPGRSVAQLARPDQARAAGALLGRFHAVLADWTVPLPYLRPPVHEPQRHLAMLGAALVAHPAHRLHPEVTTLAVEIEARLNDLPAWPTMPSRLVHGDPKISNLLFDEAGRGLCLVDLDTLARGPLVPELGDAFRSWCNPGPEDASEAGFSLDLFDAAVAGYAAATRQLLTVAECQGIVAGTEVIYLELAARFAADALNESYFGWSPAHFATRGDHNLARARNQLAAAGALRAKASAAEHLVARYFG